jgi:hypothetical protein
MMSLKLEQTIIQLSKNAKAMITPFLAILQARLVTQKESNSRILGF